MNRGKVYVVGAGPGDPELMTVKARRALDEADVVYHDSLVGDDVVDSIPGSTDRVYVGKEPGGRRTPQEEINRLMVESAETGDTVVRLKGGDPNVFGRGGEETQYLADQGVEFEVVPGVSSATAAPGVAGVPVTHRDHASTLTVVTGHEDPTKSDSAIEWGALATNVSAGGTLVVLMGVGRLEANVGVLRRNGVSASTPVAMVERGTLDDERTVTASLDGIVDEVEAAGIEPPAVTVVGDVVGVRDDVRAYLDESGLDAARAEDRDAEAAGLEVVRRV